MTRQELNQKIYDHLEAIREDVKAYAEGIGEEFTHLSVYISSNSASAFSIAREEEGRNIYLVDMTKREWHERPQDDLGSLYIEEEKNGENV